MRKEVIIEKENCKLSEDDLIRVLTVEGIGCK